MDDRSDIEGDDSSKKIPRLRGHNRRSSAERIDVEQLSGHLKNYDSIRIQAHQRGEDVNAMLNDPIREHSAIAAQAAASSRASSTHSSVQHSRNSSIHSERDGEEE
jgi:hypothetical protein